MFFFSKKSDNSLLPFFFFQMTRPPPSSTLFPYTPLFRPPSNANATASHWLPRTRSFSTGQAMSIVQNGIVKTSTAVRPAPPPASAIVVAPKLIVVWKNRSEEHTSELQSQSNLVCRLLLAK